MNAVSRHTIAPPSLTSDCTETSIGNYPANVDSMATRLDYYFE